MLRRRGADSLPGPATDPPVPNYVLFAMPIGTEVFLTLDGTLKKNSPIPSQLLKSPFCF
jgi:hypothetical protein